MTRICLTVVFHRQDSTVGVRRAEPRCSEVEAREEGPVRRTRHAPAWAVSIVRWPTNFHGVG
jgi:hypothetical protein